MRRSFHRNQADIWEVLMRTRIATAVSCFAIALGAASVAQAFPDPGNYEVVSSALAVEQTQALNCNINGFDVTVVSGSATVDVDPPNTLLEGNGLCDEVGLDSSNWLITDLGGGDVTISGISASTLLGTCAGTVDGSFSGNTLTIPPQSIPGDVFGIPISCSIGGTVTIG